MINLADKIKNFKMPAQLELESSRIALIILISAALLYVDFNFILKAQIRGLKKISAEAAKLEKDLDSLKKGLVRMRDLKASQASGSGAALTKAKKIIPAEQAGSLLQDISKIANSNDVTILQVKLSHEQQSGSQEGKPKAFAKLAPLFIILDLSSGYHNLGKFINELEEDRVFVAAQSIKIEWDNNNFLKQRVSLILKTYVKK